MHPLWSRDSPACHAARGGACDSVRLAEDATTRVDQDLKTNLAESIERVDPRAGVPLIVCNCPSPQRGTAWVWVFRESATNRLQQRWAGELTRPEADEFVSRLRQQTSLWSGGIDTLHDPPSKRFRLVWTLPPAPCRIYTRRGLAAEVEPTLVTRCRFGRRERVAVPPASRVEGWIDRGWTWAGISLKGSEGEESEVLRVKNAGLLMQFLLTYDGIDLLVDTGWLEHVVPRVAEVLGVAWRIVDSTETPPKIIRQSEPGLTPTNDSPSS